LETIHHDQVEALAQLLYKIGNLAEIIAVVGVAHDDVFTARDGDARF
jgi:hypothetical protein